MHVKILYNQKSISAKLKNDLQNKLYGYELQFTESNHFFQDKYNDLDLFLKDGVAIFIINANDMQNTLPAGIKLLAFVIDYNQSSVNDKAKSKELLLLTRSQYFDKFKSLSSIDSRQNYGKVFITGFGPGDPDLLTIKAVKAIKKADVIFFDDLIDQNFLKEFGAEKIYVGKRKGNHSYKQEEINEFLYQSAISGKTTVRLKGGDPFIFGRGGEEFNYLQKRFVDVEVIPGITAAFGAAASSGIALTQRGISSSVAFCSGFPKKQISFPDADTLVFYMSASNLHETASALINDGRANETPVALVRNTSLFNQQTEFSNLLDVSLGKVKLASPMVAIIGKVATNKNLLPMKNEILLQKDMLMTDIFHHAPQV